MSADQRQHLAESFWRHLSATQNANLFMVYQFFSQKTNNFYSIFVVMSQNEIHFLFKKITFSTFEIATHLLCREACVCVTDVIRWVCCVVDYASLGADAATTSAYLAHVAGAFPLHPYFTTPLPFGGLGSLAEGLNPLSQPLGGPSSPSHSEYTSGWPVHHVTCCLATSSIKPSKID